MYSSCEGNRDSAISGASRLALVPMVAEAWFGLLAGGRTAVRSSRVRSRQSGPSSADGALWFVNGAVKHHIARAAAAYDVE